MTPCSTLLAPALACTLACGTGATQAGVVEVNFQRPDQYADAGRGAEADRVRETLAKHLQALGAQGLPAQQTLRITITDIDLAGEARPNFRGQPEIRVLKGGADWPRISLRYSLSEADRALRSGDARLSDMDYLHPSATGASGPLPYETRLLTRWFSSIFGTGNAQ